MSAKNATPRVQDVQDVQDDTQPGGNRGAVSGAGGTPIFLPARIECGRGAFRASALFRRLSTSQ